MDEDNENFTETLFYHHSSVRRELSPFKKIPKTLGPSYKMEDPSDKKDLDFQNHFGRKSPIFNPFALETAKTLWCFGVLSEIELSRIS